MQESLVLESSSCLSFGTMLFKNMNHSIIFKCNFCQSESNQFKQFLRHVGKHIVGLNDLTIETILKDLQRPHIEVSPDSFAHCTFLNDNDNRNNNNNNNRNTKTEIAIKIEDSVNNMPDESMETINQDFVPPFLGAAVVNEKPNGHDHFMENEIENEETNDSENYIDAIEIQGEFMYEETFESQSQNYEEFIAEVPSNEDEVCNEIYLEPEINEDSNSSSLGQISEETLPVNFLQESGSGFEIEFLESIDSHNSKSNSGFICTVCRKVSPTRAAYEKHIKGHNKEKIHKCEICQAVFKDISNLKVHRNRHLRVHPHACDLCNKAFTTTTELKIHKRSHTGEKPYVCNYCGASYSTSSHLTAHRYRHFQIRRHKCEICDKAYFIKEDLRSHMRTHTNEKPYECGECGRAFSRIKSYKQHMDLHLSEKKFKCVCGKTFAQSAGLYLHKRTCKNL